MKVLLTYGFLFSLTLTWGQGSSYFKKGELQIGEQTTLTYEIVLPNKIVKPLFQHHSKIIPCNRRNGNSYVNTGAAAELEVVGEFSDTVVAQGSSFLWKGQYTITCWDTGQFLIPPTSIIIEDSTYDFNPVLLKVSAPKTEEGKDIYDIKESFVEVNFDVIAWLKTYWWIFVIILLGIGFWYLLKRRKKIMAMKPEKTMSLKERTLKTLLGLEQAKMWEKGLVKEHYIELSFIFRSYLSARYELNFLEKTSIETALLLGQLDLKEDTVQTIKIILDYADMVKFAKATPNETEIIKNLMQVHQIVTETSPFEIDRVD